MLVVTVVTVEPFYAYTLLAYVMVVRANMVMETAAIDMTYNDRNRTLQ